MKVDNHLLSYGQMGAALEKWKQKDEYIEIV